MANASLSFWKEDGTLIYENPKCAFIIGSVYSTSLTGSVNVPAVQGREAFVITRGRAKRGTVESWGGITKENEQVKIIGNTLSWNISNQYPQQIGGLFAPFDTVELRFFIIVK